MIYNKRKLKVFLLAVFGVFVFIVISQLSQKYSPELEKLVFLDGAFGMAFYVFLLVLAIVFAPLGVGFLLPVVSNLWGPFLAGTLSVVGWTIGAVIAFFLARKYGLALVLKFFSMKKIDEIMEKMPKKYAFWSMVFLRMSLPVDILSYALGLLRSIKFTPYLFSTILGIAPFSYIFAYSATLPIWYQILISVLGLLFLFSGIVFIRKNLK